MPHIHHEGEIALPIEFVWDYLSDLPRSLPEWLFGIAAFAPVGTQTRGLGAEFSGTFHVKPVTLRSTGQLIAWEEGSVLTIRSVDGFEQKTSLSLRASSETECVITARVAYELPGGVAGKALGKALVPIFAACVRRSDAKLRERLLELHAAAAGS
jgi:uncharacterized membrane protein